MTKFIGILNITPDSFSGGSLLSSEAAVESAQALIESGASVIDVGAESTRPGAIPITHEAEWQRLENILSPLASLCHRNNAQLSLDTRHPETAAKGIAAGVDWINDVSGFSNPSMISLAATFNAKIVLTHSLTVPANPDIVMHSKDVVADIIKWGADTISKLVKNGIAKNRIIFDPGIGFGKTATQSLEIISGVHRFRKLGVPVLIGHSRKSFIKEFSDSPAEKRDAETLVFSLYLMKQEVEYLRVHNVGVHVASEKIMKFLSA